MRNPVLPDCYHLDRLMLSPEYLPCPRGWFMAKQWVLHDDEARRLYRELNAEPQAASEPVT